jgi:hypothetical protein
MFLCDSGTVGQGEEEMVCVLCKWRDSLIFNRQFVVDQIKAFATFLLQRRGGGRRRGRGRGKE